MVETLIPLVAALAVVVVVPGPNVVAVVVASARDRRAGLLTALGVSTGDMIWAAAALAGVGALLEHARPLFLAVRWAGAAYLVVLAVRLWRSGSPADEDGGAEGVGDAPSRRPFVHGVLVDLANPKAAVFFTSLYASLVPGGLDPLATAAILLATATVVFGWYCALAVMLSRSPAQRAYRRVGRTVNRVAAGVMGALGLRLALSS
jgi:threonine/homoserine/homoserine lactone efflux protein